jgi:hypothetical protein
VQGVHKNSVRSFVRSVPGGHTRTSHKLRRDSARSAQSEHKECTYTQSSVKSQGKVSARSARKECMKPTFCLSVGKSQEEDHRVSGGQRTCGPWISSLLQFNVRYFRSLVMIRRKKPRSLEF